MAQGRIDHTSDFGFEDILYEKGGGIAQVTMNRPDRYNAFRIKTIEEMTKAWRDLSDDDSIGVVILTGAGEKAFCTGGDMKEPTRTKAEKSKFFRRHMELSNLMRNNGKPIIAKIRGFSIGGGNELNVMCDLSIASENAIFGQAGPRVGGAPTWYGIPMIYHNVGDKRAREVVYLCRQYTAQQACEMGMVNKVVPDDQLDQEVEQWANEILDKSPEAIRIVRAQMNFLMDMMTPSVTHGNLLVNIFHTTTEAREGVTARQEKRPPDFRKYRTADI